MASRHPEWLDSAFTWVRSRVGDAADSTLLAPNATPPESPTEPLTLEPGAVIAGLRLDRLMASGASGAQLFVAIDPATGQTYAVKAFDLTAMPPGPDDPCKRFLHECRVAASLRHADIVRVYRIGEERGQAFLVMELLSGSNLSRYTKPARLLPEPMVLRIAARIAGALAYAHAHGVIHRDIKPANVMFDAKRDRVTITDFGIASLAHAEHPRGRKAPVIGSPASMAPEQLTDGIVDGRADLYALGVLLYQMLAGRLPHEARTIPQLAEAIIHGRVRRLAEVRPDLPSDLAQLVARLLDKNPSRRPDNADRVAQALLAMAGRLDKTAAPAEKR
jgi:serine/threonine protein kinase